MGSAAHGDVLFFGVLIWKSWNQISLFSSSSAEHLQTTKSDAITGNVTEPNKATPSSNVDGDIGFPESFYLKDLSTFVLSSLLISYAVFFGVGGFLQW